MNYSPDAAASDHRRLKPFRCLCGSLLARLVPGGVELKCRRCKRQIVIPLEKGEGKNRPNKS